MPVVPSVSPVTNKPVPSYYIHSSDVHFQDTNGRSLLLRGINLSGASKAPIGQSSQRLDGFWEDAEAGRENFVNRPLNLDDGSADVHLARLRAWGFNTLRFVFMWEAIEHAGPGKYDEEYLEYLVKVLRKCKEWGFKIFMDPHQDVWSRFTGGSGAPIWTLYACGIDPQNIYATAAALIHSHYPDPVDPHPQQFPGMIWGTNYTRLANQTIWTLFFAGKEFAPKCIIDGKNIQDWLLAHYLDAVGMVAKKIADAGDLYDECIIGWDSLNEPGEGYVGLKDLAVVSPNQQLKKGSTPTPFEGMRLGMGEAVPIAMWDFGPLGPRQNGTQVYDPKGAKLWLSKEDDIARGGGKWGWKRGESWEMGTCIWAQHGVWDTKTSKLLLPDYFHHTPRNPSREVEFVDDFFRPHWIAYAERIRQYHPEAINFIQAPVMAKPPHLPESVLKGRVCNSAHYYDGLTLMTKHWNWFNADALGMLRHKYWSVVQAIRVGETAIRNSIQGQLSVLMEDTAERLGKYPTLIGEIGCPYDMDDRRAYGYSEGGKGEGDYSAQQKAWDCSLNATDGTNCLNYTMWTYVPDNSHEWGDQWNGEDLSIWSPDDCKNAAYKESASAAADASKQHPSTVSMVSSSTTLVGSADTKAALSPQAIQDGRAVSASLLLDGARAIHAIARPFPIATVGVPLRVDFDIASASFKLSVTVASTDKSGEGIATEIYLPFIHFAKSLGTETPDGTSIKTGSSSTLTDGSKDSDKVAVGSLSLDIEVNMSNGSYTTEGQNLTWVYDPPTSGEKVYTIEIKRKGGSMKNDVGTTQQGNWSDIKALLRSM